MKECLPVFRSNCFAWMNENDPYCVLNLYICRLFKFLQLNADWGMWVFSLWICCYSVGIGLIYALIQFPCLALHALSPPCDVLRYMLCSQ